MTSSNSLISENEEKQTLSMRARKILQSIRDAKEKKSYDIKQFNQYTVLPNLLKHIESRGEVINFFEKAELKQGVCNGLSAYYLYSRSNKRKTQFFSQLASSLKINPDSLDLDKLSNYVRWLHRPGKYLHGASQSNFSRVVNYIKLDQEPEITSITGITFPFNEEEFVTTMRELTTPGQMIPLSTFGHAMAIFVDENEYCFFDPDFNCDDEISFTNLHDLYVWLVLESVSYQIEKLDEISSEHFTVSMNFYSTSEQKSIVLTSPQTLMTEFLKKDPKGLLRGIEKSGNPLFLACAANQPNVVKVMLEQNSKELIDLRETNSGLTPLMICCDNDHVECAELLIKSGANINATLNGTSSALDKAVRSKNLRTVEILIKNKADIYLNAASATPLFSAIKNGNLEIFKCLFKKHQEQGGDANHIEMKQSFLYSAIENNKEDIALFLIENGANPNFASSTNFSGLATPLQIAVGKGNLPIIKALLAVGGHLGKCRESLIVLSARSNNLEVVKFFIGRGQEDKKYSVNESQADINEAFSRSLSLEGFFIAEYLFKIHKATSQGHIWVSYDKLQYVPEILSLLKQALLSGNITHLTSYDIISHGSLAAWAFENSRNQKKEGELSIREECANLIMDQIRKSPYQLFLTQATFKMKELYNFFDLESEAVAKKLHDSYQFTRFYYQNNYEKMVKKMIGLENLILLMANEADSVAKALEKTVKEYPNFLERGFSNPVRGFVAWLKKEEQLCREKTGITNQAKDIELRYARMFAVLEAKDESHNKKSLVKVQKKKI